MKRSSSLFFLLCTLLLLCFPVQAFANFNEFLTSVKWEIFTFAIVIFVPVSIGLGLVYKKVEYWLFFLCIFFTCKPKANIHFIHNAQYSGTARGLQLTFVDIFIIIILALLLLRSEYRFKINPKYFLLMILMWLWGLYSAFTLEPENMLYGFFEVWQRFWILLFFLVMSNFINSEQKLNFCIFGMSIVGVFVGLTSLHERYILNWNICTGGFMHQNSTVMFCHVYGTLALSQVFNVRKSVISKMFYLLNVFLYFAIVILTLSRAGLVAFLGSLSLFSIGIMMFSFSFKRFLFICFAVVGLMIFITPALDSIIQRFESAPIESRMGRVWFFRVGMEMIKANPLRGTGINNVSVKLGFPYTYADRIEPVTFMKDGVETGLAVGTSESALAKRFEETGRIGVGIPESAYLVAFIEEGLIGFIIYILILLSFYITSIRNAFYFRKVDQLYFLVSFALFSALTFIYLQTILEWVIKQRLPMYQLYLSFAIIGFIANERRKHKKNKKLAIG